MSSHKMKIIISNSNDFKVEIIPMENNDTTNNVKLMDKNGKIIHEYIQKGMTSPINKFVTINNKEWWIGGRHYMLRLFVNCETGQVFDDPDKREQSKSYKTGHEFIWAYPPKISPNGNYLLVVGCIWSFPYEYMLYDISNMIKNIQNENQEVNENAKETDSFMIREIPLHRHLRYKDDFQEDDPRYEVSENWIGDDDIFVYEFVKDNEITIKYKDEKEWKYYNTIDLFAYE